MWSLFRAMLGCLILCLSVAASAARDPADLEQTSEHPEIARFPGFFIDNSKQNDFNEFEFATRGEAAEGEVKEGRYWFVDYILKEGARQPSPVELIRNYENAFRKAGGALVRRYERSAVYRTPLAGGGERWVQLSIDGEGGRYQLAIIETGAMVQKVEFSAGEMVRAIQAHGFVALNGIVFDTGKATIKPESERLLAEVVVLLRSNPALRLSVEGHTDSVGDPRANQELSQRRAERVVAHLVGQGIAARRLRAVGKGDTVPVADNRSEAGRAKNRRVELVRF